MRDLRRSRDLSQEGLALEAGLDPSFVGRLERDQTQPTLDTLFALARALKIRASLFIIRMER